VQIEFLSDNMGFKSADKFETDDSKIFAFIDSTLRNSLTPAKENDLENNHTNRYLLKLSNETVEYSCELYYDTLYDKPILPKTEDFTKQARILPVILIRFWKIETLTFI